MYKLIILLCAVGLCCIPLFAQMGDQIDIKKIPGAGRPTMDGSLSDWPSDYNVGGFTKYENVILANPDDAAWADFSTDYQANIFLAHDGEWIYLGWECTVDDDVLKGTHWGADSGQGDNIKICFGSTLDVLYVWNWPIEAGINPKNMSYPYDVTQAGAKVAEPGSGDLPIYEIRLMIAEIPRYNPGTPPSINVNFMTEDYDNGNSNFVGLGVNFPANLSRQDNAGNPWENSLYYPTLNLTDTEGAAFTGPGSVKDGMAREKVQTIAVSPNPFSAAANISYSFKGKGNLSIYDVAGHLVKSFALSTGQGTVTWDGRGMAGGVYIARLESQGKIHQDARLIYMK
jgi:hypothetical protein